MLKRIQNSNNSLNFVKDIFIQLEILDMEGR